MRQRHSAIGLACLTVMLALAAETARADVYALTGGLHRRGLVHYDDAGRFVEMVPAGTETADGLTVSPDGWVYVAGNLIGMGSLERRRVGALGVWGGGVPPSMGPYQQPGGIAAGSDGTIYVTSTHFRQDGLTGVLRYHPANGTLDPVVTAAEPDPQRPFDHAYAVAVAPAGNIYLGRYGVGIERYSPGGELLGLVVPWTAIGGPAEDFELGPDGNLYVPTARGVDRYNRQTGALIDHFIPNGAGGLNGALDLSFGADGFVYVNSPTANSVLRYDAATGAFHDVFVAPDQYGLAPPGGLRQIVYVVPEPAALGSLCAATGILLLRRARRCR